MFRSVKGRFGGFAVARSVFVLAAIATVAGCSDLSIAPGGSDEVMRTILLGSSKPPTPTPLPEDDQLEPYCPPVEIRSGAAHHVIYEAGAVPDPRNILYQATLTKTARECDLRPGYIAIKVGFAGRLLLGPKGQPGSVNLRIRVDYAGKSDKVVWTKDFVVPATITPGEESALFTHITDELVYQHDLNDNLEDFKIYISFVEIEGTLQSGGRRRR